jgi:hypothetical protein
VVKRFGQVRAVLAGAFGGQVLVDRYRFVGGPQRLLIPVHGLQRAGLDDQRLASASRNRLGQIRARARQLASSRRS